MGFSRGGEGRVCGEGGGESLGVGFQLGTRCIRPLVRKGGGGGGGGAGLRRGRGGAGEGRGLRKPFRIGYVWGGMEAGGGPRFFLGEKSPRTCA